MRPSAPVSGAAAGSSDDRLRLFVDAALEDAVITTDVDGSIASWNAGAAKVFGYEAHEVIGRHIGSFDPPDDPGDVSDDLLAAAIAGRVRHQGWRVRKDGSQFWADVSITTLRGADDRLLGFGHVVRDDSDRKRRDDELRRSEQRSRLLIDGIADYAIFRLTPAGEIASWNLGAERLKGYRADEVLGQHFDVFYTDEDRRAGVPAQNMQRALELGRFEVEGWRVRKDGRRFWADVVITALVDADGHHDGFAKITRDLTDRKRAEDALRGVLERERAAADQLRELDQFRDELVAIVAHDIRGPLAVIRGFAGLLSQDWDGMDDADKLDLVRRIDDRTAAASRFVNDVFDTARIEAGHLTVDSVALDLRAVVARVVADAEVQHAGRTLVVDIPDDLPSALGDDQRTWQILYNLVTNALKFSPADEAVHIGVTVEGPTAVVAVEDRGAGIPEGERHLLFQRFTRLPGSAATVGSGMGLFIARSLADAQGGRVWFEPAAPVGSRFCFTVPLER